MLRAVTAMLVLAAGTGCQVILPQNQPLDDGDQPALPEHFSSTAVASPGSLYSSGTSMRLFDDLKAYRPGDILTVILQESTVSSKKADTSVGKDASATIATPSLLGNTYPKLAANLSGSRGFTGKASASQQNQLTGSVTVVVQQVLPSGALFVKGSKQVRLNQGDEVVFVSGLVRPEDVTQDNQVSSQRLAHARISYTGRGDMAESNTMGWLSRILNSAWFPF